MLKNINEQISNHLDKETSLITFERQPTSSAALERAESAEALDRVLREGQEGGLPDRSLDKGTTQLFLKALIRRIDALEKHIKTCLDKLNEQASEIKRIKTDDSVLTQMSDKCREMGEQHHEREFLNPVFLALIGIADRCRQDMDFFRKLIEEHEGSKNQSAVKAIRQLLNFRNADMIELNTLLQNYGVESFEHTGEKFDPATQKCIKRVTTAKSVYHGCITARQMPGYRRYGKVLRQELVDVYVAGNGNNKGNLT